MRNIFLCLCFAWMGLGVHAQNSPYFGFFQYNRPQINPAAMHDMVYDYGTLISTNANVRTPFLDQQLPDYEGVYFGSFQFNFNTRGFGCRQKYNCQRFFFPFGLDAQSDNRGLNLENSRVSLRAQGVLKTGDDQWLSLGFNVTHSNLALKRSVDGFLFENLNDTALLNRNLSSNYLGAGTFFHTPFYYIGLSTPELLQFANKSDRQALNNAFINRTIHLLVGGRIGRSNLNDPFYVEIDSWLRFVPAIEFKQGKNWVDQADASLIARANFRPSYNWKMFAGTGGGSNLRAQGELGLEYYSDQGTVCRLSFLIDAGLNKGRTVPNLELNLSLGFP